MNVSFTGIQNVGAWGFRFSRDLPPDTRRFVCQLTDVGTKDLSEFKDVFEKFPDPLNKGFLRFDVLQPEASKGTFFMLNHEPLELEDKTLPIFEKFSKLFAKIANSQEKLLVQDEYINSNESFDNFTRGIVQVDAISRAIFLKNFPIKEYHEFANAQEYAKKHVQEIDNSIMQYMKL